MATSTTGVANVGHGAVRLDLPLNVQLPNGFFFQPIMMTKSR
jgi:hypothetical protein